MAIGADGLPVITYQKVASGLLHVAHCADIVCSSATLATPDNTPGSGNMSSLVIGVDGLPIISHYDPINVVSGHLRVTHCTNPACTAADLAALDTVGDVGNDTSITIGADGLAVISYIDTTNSNLKVAHCDNLVCSSATLSTVDASGTVGIGSTSIAIGADGLPIISYFNGVTLDLRVAHCNNATCTGAALTTLDAGGDVGRVNAITIGSDGLAVISYRDSTNSDLKVAHCNNVACSGAALATVDSVGDVGDSNSIALGADGLPIIAYRDETNQDMKLAHCSDSLCSSAVLSSVDTAGNNGIWNQVTVGVDGLPIVAEEDFNGGLLHLKVAHCSNTLCTPYVRRR